MTGHTEKLVIVSIQDKEDFTNINMRPKHSNACVDSVLYGKIISKQDRSSSRKTSKKAHKKCSNEKRVKGSNSNLVGNRSKKSFCW